MDFPRRRKELKIMDTELNDIAAAAIIGFKRMLKIICVCLQSGYVCMGHFIFKTGYNLFWIWIIALFHRNRLWAID